MRRRDFIKALLVQPLHGHSRRTPSSRRRPVDVIDAIGGPAPALAAKAVTTTIPIVFIISSDPVKQDLVTSLNRPGNATGVSNLVGVVVAKQLEMLHEMIPRAALIGALANPTDRATVQYTGVLRSAAEVLGLRLFVANAGAESDLETAFAELVQRRVDAVVVPSDALFNSVPNEIVALAAHHRLPAIYAYSEGLMSYGGSFNEPFRQAGLYTGRIWDRAPSAKILEKVVFNDRGERVGLVDDIIVTQESARQTQS